VLIVISRKEMINKEVEISARYSEPTCFGHGSFSRKSSTFRTFDPTFCRPACAALLRRDTWSAGRASN
jgi:hypothetical protein